MRIKNHFHTKSFALSLALKQRLWATEKIASVSLQKRGDWTELTKSKRLLELLLRTEVKIDQQLTGMSTVTIPETLAGRISVPAFFTFLNWRIASTEKRRCQVRGNQAVLPRQISKQEEREKIIYFSKDYLSWSVRGLQCERSQAQNSSFDLSPFRVAFDSLKLYPGIILVERSFHQEVEGAGRLLKCTHRRPQYWQPDDDCLKLTMQNTDPSPCLPLSCHVSLKHKIVKRPSQQ